MLDVGELDVHKCCQDLAGRFAQNAPFGLAHQLPSSCNQSIYKAGQHRYRFIIRAKAENSIREQ